MGEWKKESHQSSSCKREWYGKEFTGVIKYTEIATRKQIHKWEAKKYDLLKKIEEIGSKLNRKWKGRKMTAKGLMNCVVDAIPKQYRGLFDYNIVEKDGEL